MQVKEENGHPIHQCLMVPFLHAKLFGLNHFRGRWSLVSLNWRGKLYQYQKCLLSQQRGIDIDIVYSLLILLLASPNEKTLQSRPTINIHKLPLHDFVQGKTLDVLCFSIHTYRVIRTRPLKMRNFTGGKNLRS